MKLFAPRHLHSWGFVSLMAGMAVLFATSRLSFLDLEYALFGWSPNHYVYKITDPAPYQKDFFSGTERYDRSLFMRLYKTAYVGFGIAPEKMVRTVTVLEVIGTLFASWLLIITLVPRASPLQIFLFVVLATFSSARHVDMARFNQPYYGGLYYVAADILRTISICLFLRRRYLISALALCLCFFCHPILAFFGGGFLFLLFAYEPKKHLHPQFYAAVALLLVVTGGWFAWDTAGHLVEPLKMENRTFFDFSRWGSFHWFPVSLGMLSREHERYVCPILGFLCLAGFYLRRYRTEASAPLKFALAGVLSVSILGILISMTELCPALIKISLHRASDLFGLLCLPFVVCGLVDDFAHRAWPARALCLYVLMFSLLFRIPYPLFLCLAIVLPLSRQEWQNAEKQLKLFRLGLVILVTGLFAYYFRMGWLKGWAAPEYFGGMLGGGPYLLGLGVAALAVKWVAEAWRPVFVTVSLLAFTLLSFKTLLVNMPPAYDILGTAKKFSEMQLWARANTPPNSLFAMDPGDMSSVGWRENSRRSCFGSLREWVFSSWLYESSQSRLNEGLRRLSEFGVPYESYMHFPYPIDGQAAYAAVLSERYHSFDDAWRARFARKYAIDYFIFNKKKLRQKSRLPVVFENDEFLVVAVEQKS